MSFNNTLITLNYAMSRSVIKLPYIPRRGIGGLFNYATSEFFEAEKNRSIKLHDRRSRVAGVNTLYETRWVKHPMRWVACVVAPLKPPASEGRGPGGVASKGVVGGLPAAGPDRAGYAVTRQPRAGQQRNASRAPRLESRPEHIQIPKGAGSPILGQMLPSN